MFPFSDERRVRWCNDEHDDDEEEEEVREAISEIRREHATACQLDDELVGARVKLGSLINRECWPCLARSTCEEFTGSQDGNNEP